MCEGSSGAWSGTDGSSSDVFSSMCSSSSSGNWFLVLFVLTSLLADWSYDQNGSALCNAQMTTFSANYMEYNLADYCTEETWSDYPGRHLIRLEKSLRIRLPSILDFQFNSTHGHRLGFYKPGLYALLPGGQSTQSDEERLSVKHRPSFVPYCLLSFSVQHGHRIYAEGIANGLVTGGKDWFTETLHFKTSSENEAQSQLGTFSISTEKNSLTLVFEQLHLSPFSLHLILTPFHQARQEYAFGCDSEHEYQCNNGRCIAKYLSCDHHNNCGDYSDEAIHCMARVPTPPPPPPNFQTPGNSHATTGAAVGGHHFTSQAPDTYPIDSEPIPADHDDQSRAISPEYIDVPFPGEDQLEHGTRSDITVKPKPINGFHGASATGGGFLGDLFRFDSQPSNVVRVVRYLLALLVIIILVTVVNFLIWCLITKRDESFMAAASSSGQSQQQPMAPQATTSALSIISV